MSVIEIVGGALIMLLCVVICMLILAQEGTRGGGIAAITGNEPDSFYNKNPGRTRNKILYNATRFFAIVLFVVTLAVHGYIALVVQG